MGIVPDPGRAAGVFDGDDDADDDGLGEEVLDVAADDEARFDEVDAEADVPPEVAAAAIPAPAASPATVTAPPMASLRSIPTEDGCDMPSPSHSSGRRISATGTSHSHRLTWRPAAAPF
ncbi:MAG TPA: hypothetical protein VGI31_01730 [Streptosporangiaceae bacterium]